jgi:hypothetical protein
MNPKNTKNMETHPQDSKEKMVSCAPVEVREFAPPYGA